jgi:Skp family chaperone for outer membrane proteins
MIMFDEIYNPFHMMQQPENDPLKDMTFEERIRLCVLQVISFFCVLVIALVVCAVVSLFTGCTTPKVVENHHHHYEQADTLAVQAMVDKHLNSWHEQMDSSWRQRMDEYSASMTSNEDQKEKVTETITTWTDSLGREMRQEQRTTERSLSRMQQQTEQRLSREFEQRMSVVVDSVNDIWQQRFDAVKGHWEQVDSTDVKETPATKTELPWYKRWWQTLKDYLLIAGIVLLIIATRRIWWPWCKKLFRI